MKKSARLVRFKKRRTKDRLSHKSGGILSFFRKFLIFLLLSTSIFVFVRANTKYWDGQDKLGFAVSHKNGDIGVVVADPKLGELTTLVIPGDTQVEVAQNFGTLRIKNVWKLSQNEKLGGKLLPETVMQNFSFPLFLWVGESGEAITGGRLSDVIRFVFKPGATNIPFGDRINLGLFLMKVSGIGRNDINLGESQFLKKQVLNDGVAGYKLSGAISERLTAYFVDDEIAETGIKVYIIDKTGEVGVADKTGQIVEVLGGKIVSLEKGAGEASDCEILAKNKDIGIKISRFFSCKIVSESSNFDVEIRLGSDFAKRF